jgi:hypothetical protein
LFDLIGVVDDEFTENLRDSPRFPLHAPPRRNHTAAVNSRKNLFIVASALLASSLMGFGQVTGQLVLQFSTTRTYRQNPTEVAFRPEWTAPDGTVTPLGTFAVGMADGYWEETGCPLNNPIGGVEWFPPIPLIGCETGATGYIVTGDLNNDGIRDDFYHSEVTGVSPSVLTEPSEPDLAGLYSAPPSKLPRPIGDWLDNSYTIYWDTQTEAIGEYKLASYIFEKNYATRTSMDQEIVPGLYQFSFPKLGDPNNRYQIPVNYYAPPEGFKKKNNVPLGFRFIRLNGKGLAWTADGFIPLDPRLLNFIEWEGNTAEYIFPAVDSLFFSVPTLGTVPVGGGDPNRSEVAGTTLFPKFAAPGTSRLLMPSPLQTGFYMPPGFVELTNPAAEGVIQVDLNRAVPSSGVANDVSTRTYQMPCRFVNTYEGWAQVAFTPGTPASDRLPDANPDGDLYSNYIEWRNTVPGGYTSDPMVRNTIPPPVLTFVQARASRSTDDSATGFYEFTHAKTPSAYPPIAYEYEYSADLVNWTVVGDDNPDWLVIDSETEIKARSRHETSIGNGFLRVKSTQAPEPPPTTLE